MASATYPCRFTPQRPGLLRSRATGCAVTRGAATRKPCFNQGLVVRAKFARRETKGRLRDHATIHSLADRGRTDLEATTQFLQRIDLALERNHDVEAAVFPGRPVVCHVVSLFGFGGASGRREIGAGGRAPPMAGSGNRSRVNRRLTDRTFCQDFAAFILGGRRRRANHPGCVARPFRKCRRTAKAGGEMPKIPVVT